MRSDVLLVIKTDDRINYPQKEKKEEKKFDSSFSTLLNGFMNNQVNQTCVEKKGTVKSVNAFGVPVTRVAKREESKEEEIVKGEERKKDVIQLSWQKRTFKNSKKVMDRNNSSKNPEITKLMQTEKFPENLVKRGLKLKAGKIEHRGLIQDRKSTVLKEISQEKGISLDSFVKSHYEPVAMKSVQTGKFSKDLMKKNLEFKVEKDNYRYLIQDKEASPVGKKEIFVRDSKVFLRTFKGHRKSRENENGNILNVKLGDNSNSSHNIFQEKEIDLNNSRTTHVESQTLKEFVKSHYEPMEGVVRFYTEMSEENSVKVLLNSRLGIAKLLFLSSQNNFQINSSVIQNLINTLNSLGFSNVSVGYNNYYGEGKRGSNQSFRENRSPKFIPVAEVESEEEELMVKGGIDIMV